MYKVHLTKSFKKDAKALNQADRIREKRRHTKDLC